MTISQADYMAPSPDAPPPAPTDSPQPQGFWQVLKQSGQNWVADNVMRLSAALSLYTILSLAPLLVFTFKIISIVWHGKQGARDTMISQMKSLMGPDAAKAIIPMLDSSKSAGGLIATVISTLILIFSAMGVFVELQDSINTIWGVKPAPNRGLYSFIRGRLLSLGMVFGIAFLLLVSMFLSTLLTAIGKMVMGDAGVVVILIDIVVSFVVVWLLFAAIFKFLPDVNLKWGHVAVGALVTAALFTGGKYGLALYFKLAAPTSAFGAAGSLAAVLIWVYYSSFILFFGAEFTKVWTLSHDASVKISPFAVAVAPGKIDPQQRTVDPSSAKPDAQRVERTAGPAS